MSDWKTRIEKPTPQAGSDRTLEESVPFSPRRRPSYPQLCILDDASENEETLRLRSDRLTIGRENCDLSFPAEGLMSRQHAMISLQEVSPDHWSWVLEDLSSRNGVFVRCKEFSLRPGNEFLIGGTKLLMHGDPDLSRSVAKDSTLLIPYQANEPISNRFELEPRDINSSRQPCAYPSRERITHSGATLMVRKRFSATCSSNQSTSRCNVPNLIPGKPSIAIRSMVPGSESPRCSSPMKSPS